MAQIQPITECPVAFTPLAAKINEIIAEMNRRELSAGPGIKLTPSDLGTIIEVAGITGELDCTTDPPTVKLYGA